MKYFCLCEIYRHFGRKGVWNFGQVCIVRAKYKLAAVIYRAYRYSLLINTHIVPCKQRWGKIKLYVIAGHYVVQHTNAVGSVFSSGIPFGRGRRYKIRL